MSELISLLQQGIKEAPVVIRPGLFSLGFEPHLETEVVRASFYKHSIDYLAGPNPRNLTMINAPAPYGMPEPYRMNVCSILY